MLDAKLLKPRSLMLSETACRAVNNRDFRETGPWFSLKRRDYDLDLHTEALL